MNKLEVVVPWWLEHTGFAKLILDLQQVTKLMDMWAIASEVQQVAYGKRNARTGKEAQTSDLAVHGYYLDSKRM